MYLPSRFENKDSVQSFELIENNPFATVISIQEGEPFVSHLPLVLEKEGDQVVLYGHLARANPHWKFLNSKPVYVIFQGPHKYITPIWYAENDVPTWNYAVVHLKGNATLIQDSEGLKDCLRKLSDQMEKNSAQPWKFWIPEDLAEPGVLEKAIVGFKIQVESIQSKFKLSQNRSLADRNGVLKGLSESNDDMSRAIHALMSSGSLGSRKP